MVVALGILGATLTGIVSLYATATTQLARNDARTLAARIASQAAESFGALGAERVPACMGPPSCRDAGGSDFAAELSPSAGVECTRWVEVALTPGMPIPSGQSAIGARYRVDTVLSDHPDTIRQLDSKLLTVNVCWMDAGGFHELTLRRMLVPGV